MAIQKKSLASKKTAAPALSSDKKKSSVKAKVDTAKPTSSKVIAAVRIWS